jgi:hypothetical protein
MRQLSRHPLGGRIHMKKNYLFALILICLTGSCTNKRDEQLKSRIKEDWISEQVSWYGKPLFIRYNRALKSFPKDSYQDLIRVSVQFKSENLNGFPNDSESAKLWKYEDTLVASLTKNDESIFVGTITFPNRRHFLFYSSKIDSSKRKLESIQNLFAEYQVEHGEYADSIWGAYEDFYRKK